MWVSEPGAPWVYVPGQALFPGVPTGCAENQFSNGLSLSAALRKLLCSAKGISVLFKILNYP